MLTFIDACVLIAVAQGNEATASRVFEIVDDPDREFVVSDFLKLEVIPKPTFNRYNEQVQIFEEFFKRAALRVESTGKILSQALDLACRYDLSPLDALHISTAIDAEAEEFITLERLGTPMTRVKEVKVISIHKS